MNGQKQNLRDLHDSPFTQFYFVLFFILFYESRKRELKTRPIYEDRWDERLKLNPRNLHDSIGVV
jgi:hypothetical protein